MYVGLFTAPLTVARREAPHIQAITRWLSAERRTNVREHGGNHASQNNGPRPNHSRHSAPRSATRSLLGSQEHSAAAGQRRNTHRAAAASAHKPARGYLGWSDAHCRIGALREEPSRGRGPRRRPLRTVVGHAVVGRARTGILESNADRKRNHACRNPAAV